MTATDNLDHGHHGHPPVAPVELRDLYTEMYLVLEQRMDRPPTVDEVEAELAKLREE